MHPNGTKCTKTFTSSAHFTSSFVRAPNGPECPQIVRNAPKCQFRVQWVGSGAFVVKNSAPLRDTNYCTSSARFAPSFVRQPNGPKHTEVVRKHQNISLGSNGVDRVHSLRKILTRLRGTNFCTSSARFAPSIVRQPNSAECTQMVRNTP